MNHASPEVSVVIPTLPGHSIASIQGLKNQRCVDYEVIIVEDDTMDICEARNEGIRRAKSELIALTDDDTDPPRDWLKTAIDTFDESEVVLLGGPVGDGDYNDRMFIGCNMVFTKSAWKEIGGFDSRFAGWMDDVVFGWEIENTFGQESTKYEPEFKMCHPPPMRSEPDKDIERLAREEYPEQFFEVIWNPTSPIRKVGVYAARRSYHYFPSLWERIFSIGRFLQTRILF